MPQIWLATVAIMTFSTIWSHVSDITAYAHKTPAVNHPSTCHNSVSRMVACYPSRVHCYASVPNVLQLRIHICFNVMYVLFLATYSVLTLGLILVVTPSVQHFFHTITEPMFHNSL